MTSGSEDGEPNTGTGGDPGGEPDRPGPGDPLAGLYDPEIAELLDRWESRVAPPPLASRLNRWSRSTALGAVAAGFAFGLKEVLDPPRDEAIVIEVDADGEPHDLPIRLLLDPDDPSGSLCIVRRDPPPPVV